ncbi:MAG: hypothetical protein V3V08_03365, partial [Nannocystaceae bacterium]
MPGATDIQTALTLDIGWFMGWFMGWFILGCGCVVVGVDTFHAMALGMRTLARALHWVGQRKSFSTEIHLASTRLRADLSTDMRRFAGTTRALIVDLEHASAAASGWRENAVQSHFPRWFGNLRDDDLRSMTGVSGGVMQSPWSARARIQRLRYSHKLTSRRAKPGKRRRRAHPPPPT